MKSCSFIKRGMRKVTRTEHSSGLGTTGEATMDEAKEDWG